MEDFPEARPTSTIEDYLTAIFVLERDGEPVIGARLAEILEVSAPTVTATLKRMSRDGWISTNNKKEISLTEEGGKAAKSVIRRHMLSEWMLAKTLNMPLSSIHEEAHNLEHSISSDIEERMRDQYGDPAVCPHGNPLPGHENAISSWIPLLEVQPGSKIIIRRVHEHGEDNRELLSYLETNGLVPGTHARVIDILPFNETISLDIQDNIIILGITVARYIYVELSE